MASLNVIDDPASPEQRLTVRITPTIEREYRRRGVFPELRLDAVDPVGKCPPGLYKVSVERAKEILVDAERMLACKRELPRGLPKAYGSLAEILSDQLRLEERRGLWDDPGIGEAILRAWQSPAQFEVGEKVLCFDDGGEYGLEAIVVGGYGMYSVACQDGPYINEKGNRGAYRFGYRARHLVDGKDFFYPAHSLTRDDCRPAHLCLAASRHAPALC